MSRKRFIPVIPPPAIFVVTSVFGWNSGWTNIKSYVPSLSCCIPHHPNTKLKEVGAVPSDVKPSKLVTTDWTCWEPWRTQKWILMIWLCWKYRDVKNGVSCLLGQAFNVCRPESLYSGGAKCQSTILLLIDYPTFISISWSQWTYPGYCQQNSSLDCQANSQPKKLKFKNSQWQVFWE